MCSKCVFYRKVTLQFVVYFPSITFIYASSNVSLGCAAKGVIEGILRVKAIVVMIINSNHMFIVQATGLPHN